MKRLFLLVLLSLAGPITAAEARPCRAGEMPRVLQSGRPSCEAAVKPEPYDPEALRAGRAPGFIDLGGGTEVRIGGRARMEYDTRGR